MLTLRNYSKKIFTTASLIFGLSFFTSKAQGQIIDALGPDITSSFSIKKGDLPRSKEAMLSLQEYERRSIINKYEQLLTKYPNNSPTSDQIKKAITTLEGAHILYKELGGPKGMHTQDTIRVDTLDISQKDFKRTLKHEALHASDFHTLEKNQETYKTLQDDIEKRKKSANTAINDFFQKQQQDIYDGYTQKIMLAKQREDTIQVKLYQELQKQISFDKIPNDKAFQNIINYLFSPEEFFVRSMMMRDYIIGKNLPPGTYSITVDDITKLIKDAHYPSSEKVLPIIIVRNNAQGEFLDYLFSLEPAPYTFTKTLTGRSFVVPE